MKSKTSKILTILVALALVSYVPLLAQLPEEDAQPPEEWEEPEWEETEPIEEEVMEEPAYQPEPYEPAPAEPELVEEEEEEELPATSGALPLIALLGGMGVASGLWLRLRSR